MSYSTPKLPAGLGGGPVTPEERYAKIDERLDAIAQHVQILSEMQVRSQERMAKPQKGHRGLVKSQRRTEELMNRLANIVIRHEERLDALDGGDQ